MSYEDEIEILMNATARDFATCVRSDSSLKSVIARYLAQGMAAGISQGELIDFLGVSSPSVLEMSGYSEVDQMLVMRLLGEISDHEIDTLKMV